MVTSLLARVQSSAVATTIGQSQYLTAALSSIHLVGLTIVVGSVVVSSLRLLGLAMAKRPLSEVTRAPGRAVVVGLAISVTTGVLLLAPRVTTAVQNGFFQLKMLLLVLAILFYFGFVRRLARQDERRRPQLRIAGGLALALWFGVVAAGAAFILLE